jgi:hypothetical protein
MNDQLNIIKYLPMIQANISVIFLLFGSGLFVRFLLQLFGQTWIKTKTHTVTLLILPIITYVITKVITGNIALSLGMVGALSIVRFRNPVRSPLELSVYFGAITMGIAASVNILWVIFLVGSITFVAISLSVISFISSTIFKKSLFLISFSEGNSLSNLVVISKKPIDICETSEMLQSKLKSDTEITYTLASSSFLKLKELEENKLVQIESHTVELRR